MPSTLDDQTDPRSTALDRPEPLDGGSPVVRVSEQVVIALIGVVVMIATALLCVEARTEPYHIDELRQVRPYADDLSTLVDASFSQEQPPLDVIVGAGTQRLLGVGDLAQRSHSVVAGVAVLVMLAVLLWRFGVRIGIPVALGFLVLTPSFLTLTAYARPYALPLALILAYVLATEIWLETGRKGAAAALTLTALLLPLSRVFEPPAFLVLSSVAIVWKGSSRPRWGRRVWWPVGSAVTALVAVELPVYLRLQSRLTAYQGDASASLTEQWRRILDDSLPRFTEVFVNGWLAFAIVVLALLRRDVRAGLTRMWWFGPMLGTAVAFAVVFHVRTQPGQPFYSRYGYFWLPVFAIVAGLLAQSLGDRWRGRPVLNWISVAAVTVYVITLGAAVGDTIGSTTRSDYRRLGEQIETRVPTSTVVVFDTIDTPFGSYRPGFAGSGRYTSPERAIFRAETLLRRPQLVGAADVYVIAVNGPVVDVDGWTAVPASPTMTLYLPDEPRSGPVDLADDMIAFGGAVDVSQGAVLRIGGSMILLHAGEVDAGCHELRAVVDEGPELLPTIEAALKGSPTFEMLADCPSGSPIGR